MKETLKDLAYRLKLKKTAIKTICQKERIFMTKFPEGYFFLEKDVKMIEQKLKEKEERRNQVQIYANIADTYNISRHIINGIRLKNNLTGTFTKAQAEIVEEILKERQDKNYKAILEAYRKEEKAKATPAEKAFAHLEKKEVGSGKKTNKYKVDHITNKKFQLIDIKTSITNIKIYSDEALLLSLIDEDGDTFEGFLNFKLSAGMKKKLTKGMWLIINGTELHGKILIKNIEKHKEEGG